MPRGLMSESAMGAPPGTGPLVEPSLREGRAMRLVPDSDLSGLREMLSSAIGSSGIEPKKEVSCPNNNGEQ